jgi:hypothetical protein
MAVPTVDWAATPKSNVRFTRSPLFDDPPSNPGDGDGGTSAAAAAANCAARRTRVSYLVRRSVPQGRPANKPRTPLIVEQVANSRTSFPCPDRFFSSLSAQIRLVLGVKKSLDWLGQKYSKELIDLLFNSCILWHGYVSPISNL